MLRTRHLALGALVLTSACDDEDLAREAEGGVCPAAEAQRIAAPPPGWTPGVHDSTSLSPAGDALVVTWSSPQPGTARTHEVIHPCGSTRAPLAGGDLGVDRVLVVDAADGPLAYGLDGTSGALFLLDRLAEPDVDAPRRLGTLPLGALAAEPFAGGALFWQPRDAEPELGAAAIGAPTLELWFHGGPDDPALRSLAEDVASFALAPDGEFALVLGDDGSLRSFSARGEVVLAEGVRAAQLAPDGRRVVWQQISEVASEPVRLRDLDSGAEVRLASNLYTALAWGRDPEVAPHTGTWMWTGDGRHLALIGPDGALARVHRSDTGARVQVPAHRAAIAGVGGGFWLELDDLEARVDAHWDPAQGDLFEWRRGPAPLHGLTLLSAGPVLEYFEADAGPNTGALWTVERATGEARKHLPRVGAERRILPDGRVLTALETGSDDLELVVIDPDTLVYKTLSERARPGWTYREEDGVYYFDFADDAPGLWLAPIPLR